MRWLMTVALFLLTSGVCPAQQSPPVPEKETTDDTAPKPFKPPVALHTVAAEYPDLAEQRRLNGQCTVSTLIDTKGVPREIKVLKCTNPLFSLNSYAAVNLYRFKPAEAE